MMLFSDTWENNDYFKSSSNKSNVSQIDLREGGGFNLPFLKVKGSPTCQAGIVLSEFS